MYILKKDTGPSRNGHQKGFTLIELSIVLVIIGLIVGGILVGQDLIRAAEIRATVGQIEKYNTAVNTFRSKYGYLPGDIAAAQATNFGLTTRGTHGTTSNLTQGDGDGNGQVESCGAQLTGLGCETSLFWDDLGATNYTDFTTSLGDLPAALTSSTVLSSLPNAKLGRGNVFLIYTLQGVNYFFLGTVSSTSGAAQGAGGTPVLPATGLTPNQAYNIDKKMDDGIPTTGVVQVTKATQWPTASTNNAPTASTSNCTVGSPVVYNTTTSNLVQDTPLCTMQFRFN